MDRDQLLSWAATCDEIAAGLQTSNEAVAVSAEFCALRLRRMANPPDPVEWTVRSEDLPKNPTCPVCGENVKGLALPMVRISEEAMGLEMPCGAVVDIEALHLLEGQ